MNSTDKRPPRNAFPSPTLAEILKNSISMVIEVTAAYLTSQTLAQKEKAERIHLKCRTEVQLSTMAAEREKLLRFLEESFAGRRRIFSGLLTDAHEAVKIGDAGALEIISQATVDLVRESPFKVMSQSAKQPNSLF